MTSVRVTLTLREGTTIVQTVDLKCVLAPLRVGWVVPYLHNGRRIRCEVLRLDSADKVMLLFLKELD